MCVCVLAAGEIMCTLHARVVEEYQRELQPGAVLILRQVLYEKSHMSLLMMSLLEYLTQKGKLLKATS